MHLALCTWVMNKLPVKADWHTEDLPVFGSINLYFILKFITGSGYRRGIGSNSSLVILFLVQLISIIFPCKNLQKNNLRCQFLIGMVLK